MWRPVLLRKLHLHPYRSLIQWHVSHRITTCHWHTSGCQHAARSTLAYGGCVGVGQTRMSFLTLVQPCCIRALSSTGDNGVAKGPDKMGADGSEPSPTQNRKLSDQEFEDLKEMFRKKFRAESLKKNIKEKQSQSFYYYTENNYMSLNDAKEEFLLEDGDFKGLRTFRRTSPYDGDRRAGAQEFIEVARTKELRKIAIRKHGSFEAIDNIKKRKLPFPDGDGPLRYVPAYSWTATFKEAFGKENGLVVMMALCMNVVNALCKLVILQMTGSNTVFSELIHSAADIMNQIALAIAKYLSLKRPDVHHPYGYGNFQPIMSIFCGIMFFSMGFGVSAYNAFQGFMNPTCLTSTSISTILSLLSVTFATEAVSLAVAYRQVKKSAKAQGLSVFQYVKGAEDPLVNVVLLEDLAGVLGVLICGGAVSASLYFNLPIIDAFGSLTIGLMMAGVSGVLFKTSTDILLGKSLWYQDKVKQMIQNDRFVNAVFDNKTIDMGDQSRLKTEVMLDAKQVNKNLLDKYNIDFLLSQFTAVKTEQEMETFLEVYCADFYDEIVNHIDRIEGKVKKEFPEIRHIDIEPS